MDVREAEMGSKGGAETPPRVVRDAASPLDGAVRLPVHFRTRPRVSSMDEGDALAGARIVRRGRKGADAASSRAPRSFAISCRAGI